jgi:hypothetical protein
MQSKYLSRAAHRRGRGRAGNPAAGHRRCRVRSRWSRPHIKFGYLYRDADNYKMFNDVVLRGRLSPAEIIKILNGAFDGNPFIPSDVGMRDLQPLFGNGWELDGPCLA